MWEHYSRKTLDDSQRLAVQVMMALGPDAKWAASTTGREMSRQNGKGDEVEVVELWGLLQRGEAILHTLHDAVLLATQTQQRMLGVLEGHPDLRRRILRKWQGTGQQMIEMRNGGIIWYRTRTGGGGRGLDYIDRLVVDEAQHATEEHIAAVSPALLANPNSQLNAMGTAGIAGVSRWWWGVRKRALSPDPGAFGYVGHTAETVRMDDDGKVIQEPIDASDRTLWPDANPAVKSGRGGGMAFLEEQYRRLGDTFAREHLGVWDPPDEEETTAMWGVVTRQTWAAAADRDPVESGWLTGPVSLAVERSEIGTPAPLPWSVSVAGNHHESGMGIDVLGRFPDDLQVIAAVVELTTDPTKPVARVVIDPASPAASIVEPLRAQGVEVVDDIKPRALAATTATLIDGLADQRIRHRNNPDLTACVSVARLRKFGESKVIDRWSGHDASPFVGCDLALWGHLQPPSEEPAGFAMILGGS